MTVRYKVDIKDVDGNRVALFDDWRGLKIRRNLNEPDIVKLIINGNDERADLFELDGQILVYRKADHVDLDYYVEAQGFLRGSLIQQFENGKKNYTAYARGWEDLLARRIIGYKSGTEGAQKEDPAETVMKEYVKENAGSLATTGNGRIRSAAISELSVEALSAEAAAGAGVIWGGSRAYRNLLEVIQEIANVTSLDFEIEKTGAKAWEFKTGAIGNDRTDTDYDRSTGKNGAGYAPVVFSSERGTIQEISYKNSRMDEVNVVFALGKGEGALRAIVTRTDPDAIDDSFINDREISRNGSSQDFTYELEDFGDDWLEELGVNPEFKFIVKQTESQFYGKDYFIGDSVTAKLDDIVEHRRIVGADINVGASEREELSLVYKDISV